MKSAKIQTRELRMSETAPEPEDKKTDVPEGFDKPTGPFANRKTPSFASETDSSQEVQEESLDTSDNEESDTTCNLELEAKLAEMKDQTLRAMAETENIRKRTEREIADTRKYAVMGFAKDLINVSDNLRRAIESVPEEEKQENEVLKNLFAGIEATERELLKAFAQKGIKKLEPLEEKFDPNFHEVMFEAPSTEHPEGIIIQIIEPGYMINDRLLRPARVGVSKGAPEAPKDGEDHHVDQKV